MIDQIVQYNKEFVANKGYEQYRTDKYPDKKLAVLSCMDTRLTELLPAALGLKNGDAKIIKNAGGLVISAFDSAMRSLIVAIYELGVKHVMVVAHSHCGACHMSYDHRASRTHPNPSAARWRPSAHIPSCRRTSRCAALSSTPRLALWRKSFECVNSLMC